MLEKDFRFNLEETAGAIGDYGTLIPIVIGVAAVTEIELSTMLFFFGLAYIGTGIYYKLPMPVEPMKAIGAITISGGLSASEVAGAGVITGVILLIIGLTGGMKYIKKYVPNWLIRGIQFGLALTLGKTAFGFIFNNELLGLIAVSIIILFYFLPVKDVSSLLVFAVGITVGIYQYGFPPITTFNWPAFSFPLVNDVWHGFIKGVIPQLPLTLGNAVLATTLLIKDLLDREVPERKVVFSMGIMCLISSPFGGFPMCHGAGGLAAQYRFGARTGGSNIISGIILLIISFFFGSQGLINMIPYGILGALLFFTSLQLFKSSLNTDNFLYTSITGIIALFWNMTVAFVIMLGYHFMSKYLNNISNKK